LLQLAVKILLPVSQDLKALLPLYRQDGLDQHLVLWLESAGAVGCLSGGLVLLFAAQVVLLQVV
jgi:hypothetical protein